MHPQAKPKPVPTKKRRRSYGYKTQLICNECGREFSKTLSSHTIEVRCPACHGYDTEVA